MSYERQTARQLRLSMIKNVYLQGDLTEQEALELLAGPLSPGDDSTIVDDSLLLNDPEALQKIATDEGGEFVPLSNAELTALRLALGL